jgi:signal transduction histidine kinase
LQQRLARQRLAEVRDAGRIHDHVQQAIGLASGVAHDLAAMDLKETSLTAALAQLAAHAKRFYKISCSFNAEAAIPTLQPPVVKQLSKIAQEAITNAIKHGKANRVGIALETNDGKLTLSIRNNISDSGKPFPDLHGPQTGMGLRIMNYRASLIGGSFQVKATGPKPLSSLARSRCRRQNGPDNFGTRGMGRWTGERIC